MKPGTVVLITGAARGIGAATARVLAARGATLSLVGLEPDLLSSLAAELGPQHTWHLADVRDSAALDAAVAATVQASGGIDVVLANAGVVNYGTVRVGDPEEFARTVDINLTGVYRTVHAALPHVIERKGYVLVVASAASFPALPGLAAYAASKAGVESLTNALRLEVAHFGVGVGCAHPSWIDTDLVRNAERDLPSFRRMRAKLPWPVNSTTTVETCAGEMADAIDRRATRLFIPRGVAVLRWLRSTPLLDASTKRLAPTVTPQLEAEVTAMLANPSVATTSAPAADSVARS
jgi:NAD(P)-dependent dehydrogenase (short-subunit alcohol dehydrogenase family)